MKIELAVNSNEVSAKINSQLSAPAGTSSVPVMVQLFVKMYLVSPSRLKSFPVGVGKLTKPSSSQGQKVRDEGTLERCKREDTEKVPEVDGKTKGGGAAGAAGVWRRR